MALDVQIDSDPLLLSATCTNIRLCTQAMTASAHRRRFASFAVVDDADVCHDLLSSMIRGATCLGEEG